MFNFEYDITSIINNKEYARKEGFRIFSFKSKNLKALEKNMKDIKSDDVDWKNKVTNLKRLIEKEKELNNRFIIRYSKDNINSNNIHSYGLYRSLITDGNKIISFSPQKSQSLDNFKNISKENEIVYQEYVEGTMINMYYDGKWQIATRSNIGADIKFNFETSLTFRDMFLEAFSNKGLEFDMFSKKYSYSFVLQHPENRIVVPFNKANIVLTNIYECKNKTVREIDINDENEEWISKSNINLINFPKNIASILGEDNLTLEEIENKVHQGLDYTIQGIVLINKNKGIRSKIRNQNYENVRILKGNSPKLQYQYYNLRNFGKVKEFLNYYPEYKERFSKLRTQLHKWTDKLWSNYLKCYVNKEKPLIEFPFEFRNHIYNLHSIYLNELVMKKRYVGKSVVINYVNDLPPDHLMSSINYPLKKVELDENKRNLINSC
tara:strand:- start:722 stop:2029 length:1308 start_codon:yes stop_codon:yes gene_type:complete